MRATITMSQLWWNPSILGFFFTEQAQNTLSELLDRAVDREIALNRIDDYAEETDTDADELGDMFHEEEVEELAEEIGIELTEEDEEEEEAEE